MCSSSFSETFHTALNSSSGAVVCPDFPSASYFFVYCEVLCLYILHIVCVLFVILSPALLKSFLIQLSFEDQFSPSLFLALLCFYSGEENEHQCVPTGLERNNQGKKAHVE